MAEKPQQDPLARYWSKRNFARHQRAARRRRCFRARTGLRRAEAPREPAALRLPTRTRWRDVVVGRAPGAELRPQGHAHGDPCRGPSAVVQQLRRHDPARPVRRRHGHRLGPRHMGTRRRPAPGPEGRQAGVHAARPQAVRSVGAGAHRQARRQAGSVAVVQEARQARQAAQRIRRGQRAARQRDRQAAEGSTRRWRPAPPAR